MSDVFYVTLQSNTKNPGNTPDHFIVHLPGELDLSESEYSVAISEISYPLSFKNVGVTSNIDDRKIFIKKIDKRCEILVPASFYSSVEDLIAQLNSSIWRTLLDDAWFDSVSDAKLQIYFTYNAILNRISLSFRTPNMYEVKIGSELAYLLGFSQFQVLGAKPTTEAKFLSTLHNISHLYVYSNIVTESIVGNAYCPLLRVISVPVNQKYGTQITDTFNRLQYHSLNSNRLTEIEILIKDGSGSSIRFEFGITVLTLEFRRKSYLKSL